MNLFPPCQPTTLPPTGPLDPPEPPDGNGSMIEGTQNSHSFKEVLLNKQHSLNKIYEPKEAQSPDEETDNQEAIPLTEEDKHRIYKPWSLSVIIKVHGKKLLHTYLKKQASGHVETH